MSDYIPPELIPNILARLPVDDALRCTSVCKSWYDLITSSSFVSLHLKLSIPNQESRLLVKFSTTNIDGWDRMVCKAHRDNRTFDEIYELVCPVKGVIFMIGYVNGLLCLCTYASGYVDRIFVWNPSLRKSFTLAEPRLERSNALALFGFGFSHETNDYKIVRLFHSRRNTDLIQVEIYELSKNSWRNVSVGQVSCFVLSYMHDLAVFLNGYLHWVITIRRHDDSDKFGKSIVSFDLKNENLRALGVPNCLGNNASCINISTFKESLCLIDRKGAYFDIWVMNEYGVPGSWTMQFRIEKGDYSQTGPLYFRENGKIMLQSMLAKDALFSYDPETRQVMNIGKYEKYYYGLLVTKYMESLVLVKSSNQVL